MQAAAGGPPSRLRRYGETAFAWIQERRLVGAAGVNPQNQNPLNPMNLLNLLNLRYRRIGALSVEPRDVAVG
jgi:hypothetical protein